MPSRMNNTFEELLPKMLSLISDMKQTEDADYEWLIQMETQILAKIKEPYEAAAAATAGPQPQPGMGPGMPQDPMQAMMAGAGMPGPPPGPPMSRGPIQGSNTGPAVDEIRRMMQGG